MSCRTLRLFALILLPWLAAHAAETQVLPTLTSARQVRELSPDEAARGYPVRLRGVLTFHDWYLSFLQDATGGIYFRNTDQAVTAGTQVEIEGFSARGRTLAMVTGRDGSYARMRALGSSKWPQPMPAVAASLDDDACDAQWVIVRGNVTAVTRMRDGIRLDLLSEGVPMHAVIPNWPQGWALPGYLRELDITVRGVVARRPAPPGGDDTGEKTVLCVPSWQMIVAAPEGLEGRFVRPRINSADLFRISTWVKPLVRVYGQVRFARPGLGFFLVVENTANVWVQTSAPGELAPGDFVDAVGWVEGRALVTDAIFRVEKPGTLTPPRETTPAGVKTNLVASHGEGVAVEGRLVEQQRTLTEDSLVMERDGVVFLARLLHNDSTQLPAMERGTRLQLTGVCQTLRMPLQENLPQTFAFQLWLSSPADAEILQRPSWWTAGRLVMLCGIILFFGLLAAGWAALLRRQVARQTAVIGGQLQREAVAEERVRIAREFHDTVQQQLAGINLELETTELNFERSPVEARESVKLSRQMIRHSLAETRQTIWDLRSPTLERGGLVAAIDDLASSLRKSNSAQIGFQTTGESRRLPGSVEQALFRIAQEAVTNALKHGQARHCNVTVDFNPRTVHLCVRDDGVGFQPGSTADDGQLHFGVLGMQERANKIGASFVLHSQPGQGTTVDVAVAIAS